MRWDGFISKSWCVYGFCFCIFNMKGDRVSLLLALKHTCWLVVKRVMVCASCTYRSCISVTRGGAGQISGPVTLPGPPGGRDVSVWGTESGPCLADADRFCNLFLKDSIQ